jgi:hypothetical protein
MKQSQHLDRLLRGWKFDPHTLSVREVELTKDRTVLQMRVDMGILQLETSGRPDGAKPQGAETYLDYLLHRELEEPQFVLSDAECTEVDREFMQFYHRRICWLRLQRYRDAVADADHTLRLMEVAHQHSPDDEWNHSHEQYRPFVWFHRTQAEAFAELETHGAEAAIEAVSKGLEAIRVIFAEHEVEDQFESDELVVRLVELRESLRREYQVGKTLSEQLEDAVRSEQYELAAELRDELARRQAG